jgi:phage baseplate assembly protein W
MAQSISYSLLKAPATSKPQVPERTTSSAKSFVRGVSFGRGVITPFRRDGKGDFANADDIRLVRSNVRQVLYTVAASATSQGELPWRPEFGSVLELLRYRNLDEVTVELARTYLVDALKTWVPRIRVKSSNVEADYEKNLLDMTIVYDVLNSTQRSVLVANIRDSAQVAVAA